VTLKNRALFVDDEPRILAGLRRTLHGLRREWEVEFVESGPEALGRLAAGRFDAVVTDVRMPGMDGAQLLDAVRKRHPATVRIILSGQCDRQAVLRCVGLAHQFLAKPCHSETLKRTLARVCGLCDRLVEPWQKGVASCVGSVPSRASLYAALIAELDSAQASIQRVAQIVSLDLGMTAKALQLVSSGFFGTPQRVSDAVEAVNLLGLDILKPLALSTEAFSPFHAYGAEARWLERLVDHSLAVGKAAKAIAEFETRDSVLVGDAFLAGFLHDVGASVLAQHLPDRYVCTSGVLRLKRPSPWETEKLAFRTAHADVGAYLMALWGLPDPIIEAIAHHHSPTLSSDQGFTPLTAVHVANAFLEQTGDVRVPCPMDVDYLERIGLLHRVEAWRGICRPLKQEGALR